MYGWGWCRGAGSIRRMEVVTKAVDDDSRILWKQMLSW